MNRLPDLINIAKCNIFANPVSFNNCLGKFSISKLLGFPMITVWVLAIVSQKFVCTLKDFKWMRSMLLQNTLNLDIKLCIAYIHTKNPLLSENEICCTESKRRAGHCEFYITYITQALLISDNKCSFFAKPTKSCSGVNHFYIPLFNKTTGLEENTNEIDLIIQEHFLRTLQKQTSQIFLM